jgi:subtilisin-like proprotein convertase family protein
MKRGIQLVRLQERQRFGLRGIGLKYDRNAIPNPFIFNRVYILIIPLLILICFTNTVFGAEEQGRWSGVIEINEEYSSDDVPKAIPDAGTTTSTLAIPDAGTIVDLNVKLNINHESDGNLDIYLIAPDGARVELFTDVGGISSDFVDTILDNEAAQSITDGSAPFTGSYRPEGNLADLYDKDINGSWTLEVTDDWGGNTGTLNSWSLIVTLEVKGPLPSPVIQGEPSLPGGILDTISWDDVGEICQKESSVAETIPDEGTVTSTLIIDDMGVIEDLNVKVNISHGWDSELDVYLISPDGTRVELFTHVGGSQDDFIDTILDDAASQSITEGSAPFTGSYRPEGSFDNLIGKEMQGAWVLEITDDSWFGSGTLNSWSLMIDKADVLYYAECAADPDFGNIVADSGWMIDRSCAFTDLDPDQEYWYRAKARPLKTWLQTSEEDFNTDTLADTMATSKGDVVLASAGDYGPEMDVIENPSMELDGGWGGTSDNLFLYIFGLGYWPGDLWSSEGFWVIGVEFVSDFFYSEGEIAYLIQQDIDWTGVESLVFDYCSFEGAELISTVFIGDQEVWSHNHTTKLHDDHYDITIDVSDIEGRQDLRLQVEINKSGWFDAAIYWDNFRTYGASSSKTSGNIISIPIKLGEEDTLDILEFNASTLKGTALTVDILPETGSDPIAGYDNVPSGADLGSLSERTIRLRANLSTSDPEVTPVLHAWSVSYTDASCESDWSNVESSVSKQ